MQPGNPIYRAAVWLSHGDNAFYVALWTMGPTLFTIIGIGWH